MKCRFCHNPLEEDCEFCSECGNEVVSIPKIVLCKGKKKNGTICGAELQKGKKFCKKCGAKVDQSIFEKEEVLCANCGHAFADDEDFCVDCGFARNGISDTLPVSTDEDSAALSSKTTPSPPSGQALDQNASLDDNVYKTSQTTLQDNDVHAEYKSDSPDKEIDKNTTEKTQTRHVQIENQPVVNNVDGTTSDGGTRICGKIDKMSYGDIYIEKKTESDLESKSIFVNERSAVEVKDDGTLEDRDYQYTSVNLELDSTESDLSSATKTAELVASSLLSSSQSKTEAQVEKEKEVYRGGLEIEKEDIDLKITSAKVEQFIKDVKDLKSMDYGSDMSFKDKSIVDQTAKGKDVSQEQLSEGSDNPEMYENASKIEPADNSSENEVVESTYLTVRLREENPKTENIAIDKSTQNLTEKEDDDRHFVEELEGNNRKAIQEAKPTTNQTSAVDEKTEDINETDLTSLIDMGKAEKMENINKTHPPSPVDHVKAEKIEDTHAADQIKDTHAANKIEGTYAADPSSSIDEVKADNIDKKPVQVTEPSIGPTNTTEEVEADKIRNINVQIKNEELNKISLEQNEVEELKENYTDKMLVHGTRYTRNPSSPITEEQENENEMSKEINQKRHANGDWEPNENPNQEKTTTSDPGTLRNESIKISNSPSGMETIKSSKFDKNQSDEKTKDSKKNQISDATVNEAHRIKNEPEGAKSLTSGKKQEPGRNGSKITRNGNQGKRTDEVSVYFHALLSPEFDLTPADAVVIRFGDDRLGGWKYDEHKVTVVRHKEDDYLELKIVLKIPKNIVLRTDDKRLQYKYLVIKDKADKDCKFLWEKYDAGYEKNANRSILLRDKVKNIDEWHQYDGVIYPKPEEKFLQKVRTKFKELFSSTSFERHSKDLSRTLLFFRPELFQALINDQEPTVSVEEGIMQLEQLVHCLKRIYFIDRHCFTAAEDFRRQVTDSNLVPIMRTFANVPLDNWQESAMDAERRMLKAITVLLTVSRIGLELKLEEQDLLARGLLVRPNHVERKCFDLESIYKILPNDKMKQLCEFLNGFIETMAKLAKDPNLFLCMPLHHFLTGQVQPFDKVPFNTNHDNQEPKWWGVAGILKAVHNFKTVVPSKWTVPCDKMVTDLQSLFELDYLLPRTMMAMLKVDEVEGVIKMGKIPLDVSAACLVYFVKTTRKHCTYSTEHAKNVCVAMDALLNACKAIKPLEESTDSLVKSKMLYMISSDLLNEALDTDSAHMLRSSVQVFLHTMAVYEAIQEKKDGDKPKTRQNRDHMKLLKQRYRGARKWLDYYLKKWTIHLEEHLQQWDNIVAPQELPSETVRDAWNSLIEEDLCQILKREFCQSTYSTTTTLLIELYCRKVENFQHCIQNCLSHLSFETIEKGYDLQTNRLGKRERDRFGTLLSDLFVREWKVALDKKNMEEDRVILHHVLAWTPFSHFLHMFYGDDLKLGLLSEICLEELGQAVSVIYQRAHALRDGTITLRDLHEIKAAEDKFQELAGIVCEKSDEKKEKTCTVAKAVKIRQKEVDAYFTQKKYVATLVLLCQHIHSVQLKELDRTIGYLERKKDLCVKDICNPAHVEMAVPDTFQPHITAFKLSDRVIQMLKRMHKCYGSNIFLQLWKNIGNKSKAVSLDDVYKQVWRPAYSNMKEIAHKLVSGEISFLEMENYLGSIYQDDYDKMVEEMILINVLKAQAQERVKQLKQFRQMEACVEGAKSIMKVATKFRLKGDFAVIETIASQENAANKMMKEFDDSLLKTCEFLEDLTPEKIKCLNNFIKCSPLVQWLRESMKGGLKELKVFVDLASISAGEGDMKIAKVHCLHAASTGYAPLIFDLDENSGCRALLEKCQILWKELKADRNLPKKLVDTCRNLEWLKTVKQAHGSVEVTSLAQAEAINSNGIFHVGTLNTAKDTKIGLDLQNTLELTVPGHGSEIQAEYTFEQLQDLQSRLMLVAGKAEQGKDDVDRFMLVFDSVTRLANVFIKLHSAGCVLFKHWQTNFLCDPKRPVCAFIKFDQGAKPIKGRQTKNDDVTAVISKIARFMENCLDKWIDHISLKRLEYLELNYFTTDQLVILQQELVKVGPNQGQDNKIYPLLSAVKENCTYEDLVDAMKKASKDVEVVQMEVDQEQREMEGQEDGEVASGKKKDEEAIQSFIEEMIQAGFSEKLARAALKDVKPDQVTEGIIWCSDHLDEEDTFGEKEDTEMGEGDHPVKEALPYEGWKKSDQSVMSIAAGILNRHEVTKGEMDVDPLIADMEVLWEEFLTSVSSSVTDYLSVEHLGLILRRLAEKDHRQINRPFPAAFVPGTPNLIICPKADVLSTVLSIYMMDMNQPLPQADEILMCTPQTTLDQLDVFWRRTIEDTSRKIHCLVNGDLLDFEVSDCGERRLEYYMQLKKDHDLHYKLVVVCSAENEYKSRIITALDRFRRPPLPIPGIHHIADYVRRKLQVKEGNTAAAVDFDSSGVRVVKSWRAGVGKSLYVKRRNEELMQQNPRHKITDCVNIPIQDKEISVSQVTQTLLTHILPPGVTTPRIFHLDIAHEVQEGLDFLLFNLLILGCLTDQFGYVWRRSSRDLYLVETMPILEFIQARKGSSTSYVHHVFDFLPFLTCRSPQESLDILTNRPKPRDFKQEDPQFDLKEFTGEIFQRSYQYLSRLDQGRIIDDVNPHVPWGTPADCLRVLLRHCGVPDPSWAELHHFVWFFNTQLIDFEKSSFCSAAVTRDLPGFSIFVLRFLIQMSRDFSTRSLEMSEESPTHQMDLDQEVNGEDEDSDEEGVEGLAQYQMRRTWESSPHPYIFFNPDGHTVTFLGFNIERNTGNLIDQQTKRVIETAIMPQNLYDSLLRNRVPISEDFDSLPRDKKIERLCLAMGNDLPHDPDDTYELTTDNVKKILAIYMRFRCDIPVIIMGETGCGKTRLVKFLCALQTPPGTDVKNMILMKVHGGTTNSDIKRKIEEAMIIAQQNIDTYGLSMYTVLFFDEANTTEAIGMIKEIMCDKSMEGNRLDRCQNLKFVAACNPYRKHSETLIKRLEQAGLGYHVDADKTRDRLGRVPMRRLVYRVQPLPQSLLPLVWDFGQLNTQIEDLYIRQMVRRYIHDNRLPNLLGLIEVVSGILTASQDFMRQQEGECSFVSLRDVERVLTVMSWFYAQSQEGRTLFNQMDEIIQPFTDEELDMKEEEEYEEEAEEMPEVEEVPIRNQGLHDITRSLVLALGVCYHACLKNRAEYRIHVAPFFRAPCHLPHGPDQIEREISACQDVFLKNVKLDMNIAKNTALKENVFMMVTSIELRIPLFLVGKPGSSKSLAKTIVADAMQGNAAHKDFFRELKQVQMVSFQCSPLSTPDGIVGTFRQCAQFQKDKDLERFVSVVVLDEVGLAEDSPRMPLKTLHPLLEDGCHGDEKPEPYKKVAFIGISNWALDPAKMNRGILVQREVPDLEELKNTAKGIWSAKGHVFKHVEPFIEPLANSYLDLFKVASDKLREFFGLRDFYSLMKMIYSFVKQTKKPPTWYQLLHSIKRNFGGLDAMNPVETFAKRLTMVDKEAEFRDGDPDCTTAGLITACLYNTKKQSESRYLLLLTENYGALTILQPLIPAGNNIITIFGSSFPSDQEYTQVCRNINRIKVCMETGNTVVLLNLENLYESLYDALNQYYVYFGGERYVDLGLGTHRVKCRIHKNFRLIVVAEKDVVYKKFPIPLINRLEKHFLTVNTILTRDQYDLAEELEKWANDFSIEVTKHLPEKNNLVQSVGEVFMGYHADTCSSIILHVWQRRREQKHPKDQIMDEAKRLLLWCATPDAVVRLEKCHLAPQERKIITHIYMREQCHDNLAQYLQFKLMMEKTEELFAQITTHSKLLSTADKSDIHRAVGIPLERIALETLQSFDTEQQFSRKIKSFFESNREEESILVVQCDSGDTNANLVACARYCILHEHQQMKERRRAPCHVVFIIQLPRIAGGCFTGFQCHLWHSVHLDDLRAQDEEMPSIMEMLDKSVGTLIERAVGTQSAYTPGINEEEDFEANRIGQSAVAMETDEMESKWSDTEIQRQVKTEQMEWDGEEAEKPFSEPEPDQDRELQNIINKRIDRKMNVCSLIWSCIQPALAMVKDREESTSRSTWRIELMLDLLHQNPHVGLPSFLQGLSCHIAAVLKQKEKNAFRADKWLSAEAAKPENINKAGTFRRACIQHFESKISPILAGIIAHIDTNHNLDIIHSHITSGDWKARLWLQILNTPGAIQLQYSDLQFPTRQQELNEVVVKTTGCEGQMFIAVMPFSWLIYEQIDGIWRTAQDNQEKEEVNMKMEKIVGLVKKTKLGQLLETLEGSLPSKDVGYLYAQDFTYVVYHAQSPIEYELVHKAIMQTSAIMLEDTSPSISAQLVSIHESHNKIVQHLQYFRSINQVWPKCAAAITTLQVEKPDHFLLVSDQFTLGILGLCMLIEQLKPPDHNYLNNAASRQEWLRKICNYRPVIEKGFDLYSLASGTRVDEAVLQGKQMWTRITVVKLFIEHVVTSEKDAEKHGPKHIMPLWVMLGDTTDLKKVQSIENVEKFLKMCNRTAIKDLLGEEQKCCHCEVKIEGTPIVLPCKDAICIRCFHELEALRTKKCLKCSRAIPDKFNPEATGNERKGVQKFKDYQNRCNSFFMDVVSQLCFVDNTAPSDQVVDKLLGYITMTKTPWKQGKVETRHLTKELTIFNDCVDPNPVFRSFLLQLLLRTSEERVHFILEKYFHKAQAVIGRDIDIEVQLCQLVVQCLEDSFYRNCLKNNEVAIAANHLTNAVDNIRTSRSMLDKLCGIAKARFGLAITAKHIQDTVLKKRQMVTHEQRQLIEKAETLCEDACKWPKIFFIKNLCRWYGVDSYQAVCRMTDIRYLRWIKYQPAEEKDRVREVSDRYIVCGPHYVNIREAVTKVVLGEGTQQLDKAIKDTKMPENRMEILLCLALYREITMSKLQEKDKSKVTLKAIEMLHKFCFEAKFIKNKDIAQKILQNKYGVQIPFLNVIPGLDLKQQGVLCLLMHCDLVLKNLRGDSTLVQPLVRLATQPQTMRAAFLPTMPQDDVEEIKAVLLAHRQDNPVFYRCPNGHPYVIGDCGRPSTVGKCPKCGLEIGGEEHTPRSGNAPDPGVDRTETGHILGHAENRTQIGPERTLTPAYCGIIRLLTHLTMMLGANINLLAVSEFIKPNINNDVVPQFLWQHIGHDLDDLHRALGKSLDDIFIILHSILSGMLQGHNENERLENDLCGLMTKGGRDKWEKRFSERYVAPSLQNMEKILKECNQQLAQDKRLGSDPLLCLLYEIAQPQENISLEMLQEIPSMWRFRSRITMEHLHYEFEVHMMAKKKQGQHKVLDLFLKEEHHLRAICYLPSILKLQRILFQKYQRKLDRAEASTITVEMLRKESDGDELPRLLDEYAEVWDLIRENLVHVPQEYRRRRIDQNTPVSQLLPTASDAGHCAYSVLEFLFLTQNEFMDNYYREVKKRVAEIPHVKVRDITPAHLISYHPEQDILPLVLANCNYFFEVGKGTTIEYNFTNLERQIMDRFLFGKSWIDIEIHLMVYRAEYTNATVFRKLQEKIPQEPLSTGSKRKISEEFHSLPDLCQALDNLDIAISFLKSIGGNIDNNLDKFMVETLKMKQSLYSPKAKQICQYQHAKSLWLLLSLEKNKKLALHNQVIFDGLPEQFHQQLSAELVEQVMASLQPLSLERLELLLDLMFECIVLVISVLQNPNDEDYVDTKEKNNSVLKLACNLKKNLGRMIAHKPIDVENKIWFKDYLLALMNEKEVELNFGLDTFPDDVLSKFCVSTWTLTYQCLQEKKRQRY